MTQLVNSTLLLCALDAPAPQSGNSTMADLKRKKSKRVLFRHRKLHYGMESFVPSGMRSVSVSDSITKFKAFCKMLKPHCVRDESPSSLLKQCSLPIRSTWKGNSDSLTNPVVGSLRDRTMASMKLPGNAPTLTSDGCGGVYFICDKQDGNNVIAVFKPRSEEFMAPENPRGYIKENAIVGETDHPVQPGFKIGNGAVMEQAAYLLDAKYNHFSGVPPTCIVTLDKKEGSLQTFVPSDSSAEDMGTLHFDIQQVQKIGILDIRLFNTDRHAGNILLTSMHKESKSYKMTPIDHGFCLPTFDHLESATFDWLHWPQAMFPFHADTMDHIESIDIDSDAALLRSLQIDENKITTLRLCTDLLQIGAALGRSLHVIGQTLERTGDGSSPSAFEKAIFIATQSIPSASTFASKRAYGDALVAKMHMLSLDMLKVQPVRKPRSISCS